MGQGSRAVLSALFSSQVLGSHPANRSAANHIQLLGYVYHHHHHSILTKSFRTILFHRRGTVASPPRRLLLLLLL